MPILIFSLDAALGPQAEYVVPVETAKVAHPVFPRENLCLTLASTLSEFINDATFSDWFEVKGQSGISPRRLALVTILQFVEGLSDRQAADAVRSRIDWKY